MKTLRFFGYLLTMVLCVSLTACSDDDDYSGEDIVGTWELVNSKGWYEDEDGRENFDDNEEEGDYIVFKADGTGYYGWEGSSSEYAFDWNIKKDKLFITEEGEDEGTCIIKALTSDKLVLFYSWEDKEYNEKGEYTETYKRIKK